MTFVLLTGCLLWYFGGGVSAQFRDDPTCGDDVIDACGTDFVLFSKSAQLPGTPSTLAESCKVELEGLSCAKDYAKRCLLGFTRGAALVAINAVLDEVDGKCDPSHAAHRRYFQHVNCMNKGGSRIHACVKTFEEGLHITARSASVKLKVPYSCCKFVDFSECTERSLVETCGDPETVHHVMQTIDNVIGDLFGVICGRYQRDSANCRTLDPLPRLGPNETVPTGLISPLKAIVRSLG